MTGTNFLVTSKWSAMAPRLTTAERIFLVDIYKENNFDQRLLIELFTQAFLDC